MASAYPEIVAGGFTRYDGTIEFYGRINSLLRSSFSVLDFGAGRASWYQDESSKFRKELRLLKGKVRLVVGQDIDAAIFDNRSIDKAVMCQPHERLPFQDGAFDIVIADFVFEHIGSPGFVASEFTRILKPGGWLCARTPNKWGYISIATRLVKNKYHKQVLRYAQPARKGIDIFPTRFLLNTMGAVRKHFPPTRFDNCSYFYQAEPAYHFDSKLILLGMRFFERLLPPVLWSNLFIFVRKR